ncbi:MAG: Propanoyl-CoA C-acyltransferase [Deltaproteobacteria bacterium]|nr:Propanoyl-CoA C-acyltransferase [Deltaproteobacteria bacterium]
MARRSKRNVAIVATGQTDHRSKRPDVNIVEMINEAVRRCLADAHMTMDQIDAIVIGNMEHFEGIFFTEMWSVDGAGSLLKHGMKITTGGTTGSSLAQAGYYHVASGLFDTVMTIGWEKQSEGETTAGLIFQADPLWERATMSGAIGSFAGSATAYMHKYGITEEQAAKVAVKNRKNAMNNPHAHLKMDLTVEQVLSSKMLAYPIKILDMCPTSDGACAMIFASEQKAKKICTDPAWVIAAVTRHDQPFGGDLEMVMNLRTLRSAAEEAYRIAGIHEPFRDFDVAELYEPCTFAELSWYQAMGFCGPGEEGKLMDSGATQMGGELPVNPSGGVLSTNCIGATAMIRVAEAAIQVMGKGGKRQVPGVNRAIATGFGGSWWSDVMILSKTI